MDNSTVHLATGFVAPGNGPTVRRWSQTDKSYQEIACPMMVHEYNKFMGGVDLCDMMLSLYRVKLKSRRWYMPIFYYLSEVAVTNAWILYRRDCNLNGIDKKSQHSLVSFQNHIASDLLNVGRVAKRGRPSTGSTPPPKRRTTGVTVPSGEACYDQIGHFPLHGQKAMRCRLCPKGKSRFKCSKCDIFLCLNGTKNCLYAST